MSDPASPTSSSRKKAHNEIVDELIKGIQDTGLLPWQTPWSNAEGVPPSNLVSGRAYRGFNRMVLASARQFLGHSSNFWLTYRQMRKYKGKLKPEAKGAKIVKFLFWNPETKEILPDPPKVGDLRKVKSIVGGQSIENEIETQADERWIPIPRAFVVYNLDATIGLENLKRAAAERQNNGVGKDSPIPAGEAEALVYKRADEVIERASKTLGCPLTISGDISNPAANFLRNGNELRLISIQNFPKSKYTKEADWHISTFHELIHGTAVLLNRPMSRKFGNEMYSFEELVAETGANFCANDIGFAQYLTKPQNSAAYLKGWLDRLRADPTVLYQAAKHAQKATQLIFEGIQHEIKEVVDVAKIKEEIPSETRTPVKDPLSTEILPRHSEVEEPVTAITIDYVAVDRNGRKGNVQSISFPNPSGLSSEEVFEKLFEVTVPRLDGSFNPEQVGLPADFSANPWHELVEVREEILTKTDGRTIEQFVTQWEDVAGVKNGIAGLGWKAEGIREDIPFKETPNSAQKPLNVRVVKV